MQHASIALSFQLSLHPLFDAKCACCSEFPHCTVALQAEVTELEAVVEEVHNQFQSLDQQMSHANQTATKIGDRLQVSLLEVANAFAQCEACQSSMNCIF